MKRRFPALAATALALLGALLWQAASPGEATTSGLARPAPVQVTTL